jgi:uncharacterized protein YigA (DUF484 family)
MASTDESLTAEAVRLYLLAHPDFFLQHTDVIAHLNLPTRDHGTEDKILDFQSVAISKLQDTIHTERQKIDHLVVSVRDNASVQSQVHQGILRLVRAKNLEEILQVLSQDFVTLFDVDVVRLAMESDVSELYETAYHDPDYSGIVFVPVGTNQVLFGSQLSYISEDISLEDELVGEAIEYIFTESSWLVRSSVMLRLELNHSSHEALLAFGVRDIGRYHKGQGLELLKFLAQIVEERLDACLRDTGIDPIV